jgi:hypothetical protein
LVSPLNSRQPRKHRARGPSTGTTTRTRISSRTSPPRHLNPAQHRLPKTTLATSCPNVLRPQVLAQTHMSAAVCLECC